MKYKLGEIAMQVYNNIALTSIWHLNMQELTM